MNCNVEKGELHSVLSVGGGLKIRTQTAEGGIKCHSISRSRSQSQTGKKIK